MSADARLSAQDLRDVAETLLIPLYFRALESARDRRLLSDPKAAELVRAIDYNFAKFRSQTFVGTGVILRARQFDRAVGAFLVDHPQGTVVDIGCGLDTRLYRVDNWMVRWFCLDLPEVVALRRQLLPESARCRYIASSVLDHRWLDELPAVSPEEAFFAAEAIFPYLRAEEVRGLLLALRQRFPGSQIVFDGVPPLLERTSSLHPTLRKTDARVHWGLGRPQAVEAWHPGFKLLAEWHYMNSPDAKLGLYGLVRLLPFFWDNFKIVQYRLG